MGHFQRSSVFALALLPLLGLLGACEKTPPPPVEGPPQLLLTPVSYAELPGWTEDGQAEALPAFLRSCGRLTRQPDARAVGPEGLGGRVADWRPACAALARVPDGDHGAARAAIEAHFVPFKARDASHEHDQDVGLLTGYYEAELQGRTAFVTIKFISEQVNVVRDSDGEVVEGDPNHGTKITDIWTFARNTRSRDPDWTLVATRSPN